MEYREYPPPGEVRAQVRCLWTLRADAGGSSVAGDPALPDGCAELILNLGDPCAAGPEGAALVMQPPAALVGQITRPFHVRPTGRLEMVAVRFTPAGAAMLHRPMAPITDTWVDASTLAAARGLVGICRSFVDAGEAVGHVATEVAALGRASDPVDERVMKAVAAIEETHGRVSCATAAAAAGTTERHLRRLFADHVGITPKLLGRIRRFQRVLAAVREGSPRWPDVAYDCGYADQAHLVRDFSELGGAGPAAALASMPPFTRLFTPLGPRA